MFISLIISLARTVFKCWEAIMLMLADFPKFFQFSENVNLIISDKYS